MKILSSIRNHPIVSSFVSALFLSLLGFAFYEGKFGPMAVYLTAILLGIGITDILTVRFGSETKAKIESPIKELKFLAVVQLIVIAVTVIRFQVFTDWPNTGFIFKLPLLVLYIIFMFPVALLIVFRSWKYSLKDLGFRLNHLWLGLPIILIIGFASYYFVPNKMQFAVIHKEIGLISMILTGFLVAAIPEELTRYLLQTRLGKAFDNQAFGWLTVSLFWAFIHLPNFYAQAGTLMPAVWSVLAITPLGLLWGFMTHCTNSILPAVTVHGTNLWGLQNF